VYNTLYTGTLNKVKRSLHEHPLATMFYQKAERIGIVK